MEELNEQQRKAVASTAKNTLVIAGPGTGKTKTLTHRFVHLVKQGFNPNRIMLLTFTNAAASEMKERIKKLTGKELEIPFAGTFHSVFLKLIKRFNKYLPFDVRDAKIIDGNEQELILKDLIQKLDLNIPPNDVQRLISSSINKMSKMDDEMRKLYEEYTSYKRSYLLIDFDDMLVLMHQLMQKVPEKIDSMFDHILVDEFQDTSRLQSAILSMFKLPSLFCVGDDAQSIYSFRGADVSVFKEFYQRAWSVNLIYNYRSTVEIVELSNRILPSRAIKKHLISASNSYGGKPVVHLAPLHNQLELLPQIVSDLLDTFKPNEIAVLARLNKLVKSAHIVLSEYGIPSSPEGVKRFVERKHVKDMLSFVKLLIDPTDENAWRQLVKSQYKSKKISQTLTSSDPQIRNVIDILKTARSYSLDQNLKRFFETYYINVIKNLKDQEEKIEDCRTIIDMARNKTPHEFLKKMFALEKSEGVKISTIHKAKGLEWPAVVVLGITEKVLPSDGEDDEELFYVAVTRAKKKLVILADRLMNPFVIKMMDKVKIEKSEETFVIAS